MWGVDITFILNLKKRFHDTLIKVEREVPYAVNTDTLVDDLYFNR